MVSAGFLLTPPMKVEQTECSETSVHKIQKSGNHPKEGIQHSEHGEIKEIIVLYILIITFF